MLLPAHHTEMKQCAREIRLQERRNPRCHHVREADSTRPPNRRDDRRQVLEVAHLLRSQGYTAARDIIRREYDSSLEYARRMNIRCMLVIGDESADGGCLAVRIRDGRTIRVSREQLQQNGLMKFIEESRGDE